LNFRSGYYTYPEGERKYRVTKNKKYRRWIVTAPGLKDRLAGIMDKNGFETYNDKALLLSEYNKFLKNIDIGNRRKILLELMDFYLVSNNKTIEGVKALAQLIPTFKNNIQKSFKREALFIKNNPTDGVGMIQFEASILTKFTVPDRMQTAQVIKSEYLRHYDYNLAGLKENTLNFIKMLPQFSEGQQALSLQYYYQIYRKKNASRVDKIREIENNYSNQLAKIEEEYSQGLVEAEYVFESRKTKKKELRSSSLKAIGLGTGAVLLVTLILLLLSMIRNINRLAEAMLKNNNKIE
jgi:hypothetical protein